MNGWQWYGTKHLQVVPYMPGTPVYLDGLLYHLYRRTRDEGKVNRVFCGDDPNLDRFIATFEAKKTLQILCQVGDEGKLSPKGYSWVDSPVGVDGARSALCGFCFFDDAVYQARDLGKLGIAYWMEDLRIDTIHGIMLESNLAAKNYAKRLGFQEVGLVPDRHYHEGRLEGARVLMLRKADFWPRFERWFESKKL